MSSIPAHAICRIVLAAVIGGAAPRLAQPPSAPTLAVSVRDIDGTPVDTQLYVAVARPGEGFRQPVAELVVANGARPAVLALAPGHYDVLCSSLGRGETRRRDVEVGSFEHVTVTCTVDRLAQARLKVLDDRDRPLANVAIGPYRYFDATFRHPLSPLGEAHFRRKYVVSTDAAGTAALAMPRGSKTALWAELKAQGYAFLPGFQIPQTADDHVTTVRLSPAGAATTRVTLPESEARREWSVLLRPRPPLNALVRALPLAVFRAHIDGAIAQFKVLPIASYDAFLDGEALADRGLPPIFLGVIDIAQGKTVELRNAAPPAASTGSQLERCQDVWIDLVTKPAPGTRLVGFGPVDGSARFFQYTATSDAHGTTRVRVPRACCAATSWLFVGPEAISNVVTTAPGRCAAASDGGGVTVAVGRIVGQAQLTPTLHATRGTVTARPCGVPGRGGGQGAITVPIELDDDGRFSTLLPSGCQQISLTFIPAAVATPRRVTVATGRWNDIGRIELSPAASVLVRVVEETTSLPVASAVVEVHPAPTRNAAQKNAAEAEGSVAVARCVTDAQGWCRIISLAPGAYRLWVSAPSFATVVGERFSLAAASSVQLDDLRLPRPGALRVEVGRVVLRQAKRLSGLITASHELACVPLPSLRQTVAVPDGGALLLDGLAPGRWTVVLSVSAGEGRGFDLTTRDVEVQAGETTEVTLADNAMVASGVLTKEGEPYEATIYFVQDTGSAEEGGVTRTGPDGRFEVVLPRAGRYDVEIEGDDGCSPRLRDVEVHADEDLVLDFPATSLEVIVLDSRGGPAPGAQVDLRQTPLTEAGETSRWLSREADSSGHLSLECLQGRWAVRATAPGGESAWTDVSFTSGPATQRVVLRLEEKRSVEVTIRGEDGEPVRSTPVGVAWLTAAATQPVDGRQALTDGNGAITLPRTDGPGQLVVDSPVEGLFAFSFRLDGDLELRLAGGVGSLVIRTARMEKLQDLAGRLVLVSQENVPVALGRYLDPSAKAVVVPRIQAGVWRLIEVAPGPQPLLLRSLLAGAPLPLTPLDVVEVAPHQTTELTLER